MKKVSILLALGLIFVLAACSGAQPAQQAANNPPADTPSANAGGGSGGGGNGGAGGARNGGQGQLAVDILRLEGTDQAVTADQAKQLLPLWQKIKTMSADTTTQPADLQAVYTQIQGILTSDQTAAIGKMTFDQNEMQSLMQKYNIQITPGANGGNGGTFPTMSPDQQSTRTAARQTQQASGTTTPGGAGFGNRGGGGRGFNTVFVDPLITLLQTRAGG